MSSKVLLSGKIHRARVTQADLDYVGSVSIDEGLMEAAGIIEWEKVAILDVTNGERLETYAIKAAQGISRNMHKRGRCTSCQTG